MAYCSYVILILGIPDLTERFVIFINVMAMLEWFPNIIT